MRRAALQDSDAKSVRTAAPGSNAQLRIGTSGWSYDHWNSVFYPQSVAAADRLHYYATRFDTVEVNTSFYGLPKEKTVRAWHDSVPVNFRFAVKGSRFITHIRKLVDTSDDVATLIRRLQPLGAKLGPLLWQLPPFMKRDIALLESFLDVLPDSARHVIEFRNETWLDSEIFDVLERHNVAMANVSGDMLRQELTPTADFVYVRFHGTTRYHGSYSAVHLEPWAAFLAEQLTLGRDCYAYFNNDAQGHAPADASRLGEMVHA